ncbi:dienelactone hydrolase endo-1,3,1,4-beta-D-glucanase [Ephemerocybe angulata]|uniref:Dienelactone hydrolase endo-1,3,1,4-beta-D-glucanase n=1 Tax=Ephemerocybe angulata TaxID=980116 RepID=A0A8H6I8A4_9AGAR|nr:dienelactone hydrolase endo-1,3,1,4-beta-D-glucanase [Tulosesus angulatus]
MLCPKCVEGYELPGEPTGSVHADYQGAYLAPGPPDGQKGIAVIFLTDGFGLPLKNCKIMADKIAERVGCDVWVPDYFAGRPPVPLNAMNMPDKADQRPTVWDWLKFIFINGIPVLPGIIRNRPSVVAVRLASFFALLKEKKSYEKIGAVGYCFGGATAVRLSSTGLINSVVICHPSSFTIDEVRAIKVPSSWVCPEVDIFLAHQVRLDAEATLATKKETDPSIEYEFKDYPGTQHGFAARPNHKYPELVEAHEQALDQTVNWLKKTLIPEVPSTA